MKPTARLLLPMALAVAGPGLCAQEAVETCERWVDAASEAPDWQAHPTAHGVRVQFLLGHPRESGLFKYRLRFPPGFTLAKHRHDGLLAMTVLCGSVQLSGASDQDPMSDLTQGDARHFAAGQAHSENSRNGAILEVIGIGPMATQMMAEPHD